MTEHLLPIEWEALSNAIPALTITHPPEVAAGSRSLTLDRDDNYNHRGYLHGSYEELPPALNPEVQEGAPVDVFSIDATEKHGQDRYEIRGCVVSNSKQSVEDVGNGKYSNRTQIVFHPQLVRIVRKSDAAAKTLFDWYLNAPDAVEYATRGTKREYHQQFIRRRDFDTIGTDNFKGETFKQSSLDCTLVDFGEGEVILFQVPSQVGPSWCQKMGFEFRSSRGGIPTVAVRRQLSEIASFALGRQLLHVGSTSLDDQGNVIEQVCVNPWGRARSLCTQSSMSPLRLGAIHGRDNTEQVLSLLFAEYLAIGAKMNISEALWRYWISREMPLGVNLPILSNGIEILAHAWFKSEKSSSKGKYLEKKRWSELLAKPFEEIGTLLCDNVHKDKILKRIQSSHLFGPSEVVETFFRELSLSLSTLERQALKARHKLAHGTPDWTAQELTEIVQLTAAYNTLFHRVILALLGFRGQYIDYTSAGWPDRLVT